MAITVARTSKLDNVINVDSLHGVTFTNETQGHQFEITCTQGGEEVALTGSISARFLRANQTTVLLTGSIVNGHAVVSLLQDCYNVPGRFQLAVFNTVDGKTTCIYAAVGTVQRTQAGDLIDSGSAVPTLDELLARIEACKTATVNAQNAVGYLRSIDQRKINKPNDNPNGVNGQILQSLGDDGTTWVDLEMPDKAAVIDMVEDWLDKHPEATSTVLDKSITRQKLSNNLYNALLKGNVVHTKRVFRQSQRWIDDDGYSLGSQTITATDDTFLIGGRITIDNSEQRITEFAINGSVIRQKRFKNENMGHLNGMAYDKKTGYIYTCSGGGSNKICRIRYDDLEYIDYFEINNIYSAVGVGCDNGILYVYGSTLDRGTVFGIVDIQKGVVIDKTRLSELGGYSLTTPVSQDMGVADGYAYIVYNRGNQLIKVDIETGEIVETLYLGEGNELFQYGEIESITFLNGQGYFISSVWATNYSASTELSISYTQVFKTDIGGIIGYLEDYTGQGRFDTITIHINTSTDVATSLNPTGTESNPFRSAFEAGVAVSYLFARDNAIRIIQFHDGGKTDLYEKDALFLDNVSCYIRGSSNVNLNMMRIRNGNVVIRQINVESIVLNCVSAFVYAAGGGTFKAVFCPVIVFGDSTSFESYSLEGSGFYHSVPSETTKLANTRSVDMNKYDFETEIDTAYNGKVLIKRCGNIAQIKIYGDFTGVPLSGTTQLCIIPAEYKPETEFSMDTYKDKTGIIRVYVRSRGELLINVNNSEASLANLRIAFTYII